MNAIAKSLDPSERADLDNIGRQMRSEGWADHVTVLGLLEDWESLSKSVDRYKLTIDDYTNDLCSRDGLEVALRRVAPSLRAKLQRSVDEADQEFAARTDDDAGAAVGRYYRIDASSGWWWKRRPLAGTLADYLAD